MRSGLQATLGAAGPAFSQDEPGSGPAVATEVLLATVEHWTSVSAFAPGDFRSHTAVAKMTDVRGVESASAFSNEE